MRHWLYRKGIRFSQFLNRHLSWLYIAGHPVGSGDNETLCKHFHRTRRLYTCPWMDTACTFFDRFDKDHCANSQR